MNYGMLILMKLLDMVKFLFYNALLQFHLEMERCMQITTFQELEAMEMDAKLSSLGSQ